MLLNKFFSACSAGDLTKVKQMVAKYRIDIKKIGETALIFASQSGNLRLVKYLVDSGVDPGYKESRALGAAAARGHYNIVKYLIGKKANIHDDHDYAFRIACANNNLGIVKLLVEKGCDVHTEENNALWMACEAGHLKVVNYLIDEGGYAPRDNYEMIDLAFKKKHNQVVSSLLSARFGKTFEKFLFDGNLSKIKEMDKLVSRWDQLVFPNKEGLKGVIRRGHLHVVKYWMETGVETGTRGRLMLDLAVRAGNYEIVEYLIDKGVEVKNTGVITVACALGRLKMVKLFVSKGAKVTESDNRPLINACAYNRSHVAKYLVGEGAGVTTDDCYPIMFSKYPLRGYLISHLHKLVDKENKWRSLFKLLNNKSKTIHKDIYSRVDKHLAKNTVALIRSEFAFID